MFRNYNDELRRLRIEKANVTNNTFKFYLGIYLFLSFPYDKLNCRSKSFAS